jgi:hypothetical protein
MLTRIAQIVPTYAWRLLSAAAISVVMLAPRPALAQTNDEWHGTFSPLYLWASELNGDFTARGTTVPLFLDFGDAADKLGGAFSFHFEAQKRRWGIFSDLNFVRLSSEATFTVPALRATVEGDFDLDNTMFEIGGSYLVSDARNFAVIGGIRTYSLSPKLEFSTDSLEVEPIDASRTSVNGFVGFTFRPQLAEKWSFLSRADIGGGGGLTWSGMLGFEFRPKPWGGLVVGYKALGIDVGSDSDDEAIREYDVTHYGPIVGFNLHWGAR